MNKLLMWRYRRFHVSYLVMWLACGVLLGLILARLGWLRVDGLWVLSGVTLLIGIFRSRRWWAVALIMIVGLFIGSYRGSEVLAEIDMYQKYTGAQILLTGTILDDPEYGNRGDQQFKVNDVQINGRPMRGQVFVGTLSILDVKRGDYVELRGKLQEGFGSYQATLRYATLQKAARHDDPVRELRDNFAAGVRNTVAEPAASLGLGFVVGQRSALPETLDDQLRVVGLTHIVVASGYNLTILVRFTRRLLARHSKYLAAMISAALMTGFVLVSGLSPSMTRAAAVTGLSLLAWYYGRNFHPLILIIYVAAATAWWNPIYIWSDIGWYLSFLAFGGVLILAPLASRMMFGEREPHAMGQLIIETIAAQVMTLPLILFIFGQLPTLSLVSNLMVAPVIPLAMVATAIAGIAGMIAPGPLALLGLAANYVIGYAVKVVELLASVSWAQVEVSISSLLMTALYACIVLFTIYVYRKIRYNFRSTSVVD